MRPNQIIFVCIAVIALVFAAAGASALITKNVVEDKPVVEKVVTVAPKHNVKWNNNRQQAQPAKQAANCTDYNVVGTVLGGVAGGLVGNQIGKGGGNTAATVVGAGAGAYAGNQYIPTRNALCPK